MSKFLKKSELKSEWYEIDASNAIVGRLATVISKIIRGKNKTNFTPHMDNVDFATLTLFRNFCKQISYISMIINTI